MNIDDLTVGQVREISKMVCNSGGDSGGSSPHPYVGKVVLCRTRVAGVLVGEVVSNDGHGLRLKDSTRVWRWKGANTCSELSIHGVTDDGHTRIDSMVADRMVDEDTELYVCSADAASSLRTPRWPA